jgi:hypothetical protein
MPSSSKKKSKGSKGRKTAAKAGKQLVNEEETTNMEEQKGSLDSQMNGLNIDKDETAADEDALLEEAIKLAAAEKKELERENCNHGHAIASLSEAAFCAAFMQVFATSYHAAQERGVTAHILCLEAGYDDTKEKFSHIWEDPAKMKIITTWNLEQGTTLFLNNNLESARHFASFASFFEQNFHKNGHLVHWHRFNELFIAD